MGRNHIQDLISHCAYRGRISARDRNVYMYCNDEVYLLRLSLKRDILSKKEIRGKVAVTTVAVLTMKTLGGVVRNKHFYIKGEHLYIKGKEPDGTIVSRKFESIDALTKVLAPGCKPLVIIEPRVSQLDSSASFWSIVTAEPSLPPAPPPSRAASAAELPRQEGSLSL